jgi:amidase
MIAPHFRSAKQLASDIRRRKIGALEALDLFLARVNRFNPRLNAIVASDVEAARRRARQADAALRKGKVWGPLHGVPMTVKESYDVVGMPTTWGLSELKDNVPPRNAQLRSLAVPYAAASRLAGDNLRKGAVTPSTSVSRSVR